MKVRAGYTLVEVVVSMLISAVIITSVFTVALTSKRGGMKADSQMIASSSSQSVAKMLANYVTADWLQTAIPVANQIQGPNSANAGMATWYLDGPNYQDDRGAVWALAPGSHTITGKLGGNDPDGFLPRLRGTIYNGTLTYCVQWIGCADCTNNVSCAAGTCTPPLGATCQPNISVTANWSQP